MNLERQLRKRVAVNKLPSADVMQRVEQGRKFIPVQDDFSSGNVPQGYTLVDTGFRGNSFKALVPQSLLFYMANPGEGDSDSALEQLADFYGDAEDFEEDQIGDGKTSVQEMNWATIARSNYRVYLINKLVTHKRAGFARDGDGEPIPEFDKSTLRELDLDDPYVEQRAKAMAAVALGKTAEEVKKYGVDQVLKHVTVREKSTVALTREEFQNITCWAGSHYELRDEYRNGNSGAVYNIDKRHDRDHMVGTKTINEKQIAVFDAQIHALEGEIGAYRKKKHGKVGRHDSALLREYVNLAYIAKERKDAQLDIKPPVEEEKK